MYTIFLQFPEMNDKDMFLKVKKSKVLRLPGVEPGSIAWKAIILTVGLQTRCTANEDFYEFV